MPVSGDSVGSDEASVPSIAINVSDPSSSSAAAAAPVSLETNLYNALVSEFLKIRHLLYDVM